MRLSNEPINMMQLIEQNKEKLDNEVYENVKERIEYLLELKKHKIANIDYSELSKLSFKTEDVNTVAEAIIEEYNAAIIEKENKLSTELSKITQLEVQKYLYYVDGIALCFFEEPAFKNDSVAWEQGTVIQEIYDKYKIYGKNEIALDKRNVKISSGLRYIIKKVIDGYGKYTGGELIDLTHEEMPWKSTSKNQLIDENSIKQYFKEVYLQNN